MEKIPTGFFFEKTYCTISKLDRYGQQHDGFALVGEITSSLVELLNCLLQHFFVDL